MPSMCARAVVALVVLGGGVLPAQAAEEAFDVHMHMEKLDWTAGSVLGLQRGYKLHKKGAKPTAETPEGAVPYSSLLGFQRGIKVQKVAPPPAEEPSETAFRVLKAPAAAAQRRAVASSAAQTSSTAPRRSEGLGRPAVPPSI
uniref:Uncharacterized protein n=1 Tax=Alexandrium andersonii TaxID=327968 RepID=A0A7S2NK51_9DINO|mmetsp:Transcript_98179/g.220017  ORF Transcript_98179/g.220017 Transcript_98179/m.220017 type:complete len:143 (+) Transcript_98179:165-593(+)